MMRRDVTLEAHLVSVAARAGGHPDDGGVFSYADSRALPGPVRLVTDGEPRDWAREIREEIADGANYCCWSIQEIYPAFLAGDPGAIALYERHMRTLSLLVGAWHALHA